VDHVFPHVDVYDFPPTAERPWHTLITGGMGDYRQPSTSEYLPRRVELILRIRNFSLVHCAALKLLAEYPARCETLFGFFHTIAIGEAWGEGSSIRAVMFVFPDEADGKGLACAVNGEPLDYLMAIPITATEQEYAKEVDPRALYEMLREA